MEWDKLIEAEFATWPQFKTHKFKQVGIFAGADRHICGINAFAVAFASGCFNQHVWKSANMNYWFAELSTVASKSHKITNIVRDLRPSQPSVTYANHTATGLCDSANGSGFRVGAINEMVISGISPWLASCVTGHDYSTSTLFDYLNVVRPMIVPGG